MLNRPWFEKWVDLVVDSYYYGWSLIQLGKLKDGEIQEVTLLERRNTLPTRRMFLKDPYGSYEGWKIDSKRFENHLCLAYTGDYTALPFGMLEKAAISVLYKFWTIAYWAEHIEQFGKPKKHVETDLTNKDHFEYLKEALEGQSDTIITNIGDKVQLLASGATDPYAIYENNLVMHNNELSKLILGQQGTSEIGSNYQEASTHNTILKQRGRHLMNYVENVFNKVLLPMLKNLGYPVKEGDYAKFNVQYNKSAKEQIDVVDVLSKHNYRISEEQIKVMFDIEVEDKFDEVQKQNKEYKEVERKPERKQKPTERDNG
jgi:hypothetical protein